MSHHDATNAALNAGANAAVEEILAFARQFPDREQYQPLADLANRTQRVVIANGAEAAAAVTEAERLADDDDPNRQLGGYVEGMLMGLLMGADAERKVAQALTMWKLDMTDAPDGTHAMYFVSPSGLRWRIRAELEEES